MMYRNFAIIIFCVMCAGNIKAANSKYPKIVAEVNGADITLSELVLELLARDGADALDRLIQKKLLMEEIKRSGGVPQYDVEKVFQDKKREFEKIAHEEDTFDAFVLRTYGVSVEQYKNEVIVAEAFFRKRLVPKKGVSDFELIQYMQRNNSMYSTPEERNVQHILLASNGKYVNEPEGLNGVARKILQRLERGMSFESLVRTYSEDDVSKKSGGVLGMHKASDLVPAFSSYIFDALKKEGDMGIVSTQFGAHIVRLVSIKKGITPSFHEIEERILADYMQEVLENGSQAFVRTLAENSVKNNGIIKHAFKRPTLLDVANKAQENKGESKTNE